MTDSKKMTSSEYEQLTKDIVQRIVKQAEQAPVQVRAGVTNLIEGASKYRHQVDVSVHGSRDLLLIECKQWKKNISPQCVLEFAARLCDIGHVPNCGSVKGVIVTQHEVHAGAYKLAEYFKIELGLVKSAEEFVLKYKHLIGLGLGDNLDHWQNGFGYSLE